MGTSASFARKALLCLAAALLAFTLVPAGAFAGQESAESAEPFGTEGSEGAFGSEAPASPQPLSDSSTEAGSAASDGTSAEAGTLVASLMGRPASFVNADVALDGEPVIGSFTADGLTFAVTEGSNVELVGVSGPEVAGSARATSDAEAEGSASEAAASIIALPESVAYNDAEYAVTSIGAYAFYLSGVMSVELPASIANVDDCAFRSSDVASVTVAEGNPSYSSFDGVLYDAAQTSLLLIPEGKQGAVLLPKGTEVAEASKFSHCSLVDAISAEDGAAFASENGLLYDASLTTLLRVPAGATEIAIREGCTTIAAGAMEGCASLATINAPASVTSISPDVFTSVPTISLPVVALQDEGASISAAGAGPQLAAVVALSSSTNAPPEIDARLIEVRLDQDAIWGEWRRAGFSLLSLEEKVATASMETAASYGACTDIAFSVPASLADKNLYITNQALFCNLGDPAPDGYPDEGKASSTTMALTTTARSFTSYTTQAWNDAGMYFDPTGCGVRQRLIQAGNSQALYYAVFAVSVGPNGPWRQITKFQVGSTVYSSGAVVGTGVWSPIVILDWDKDIETKWDANGGTFDGDPSVIFTSRQTQMPSVLNGPLGDEGSPYLPTRLGYRFMGWSGSPSASYSDAKLEVEVPQDGGTWYAIWLPDEYDIVFDTSSEPGDEDYPGIEKPDETVNVESGPTVIEDPKRPGYVFQGWTIPNTGDTEAIDQDLVYQGDDGKWYVDASKLPDYAGDDGRVELTARWTSVIRIDVPSAVTFYADMVTQGNESREGLASSAFGQNKVASQSEVDLRIVGLESEQAKGEGMTTLGASDILKKKDGGAVSGTADKLFSLYPATGELKEDDLKDPDAISTSKPEAAVDFSLDDVLLEKSFAVDKFTIPAGGTLSLGYRLNLQETGTELNYDKLSTLPEDASASIANISYCFAADGHPPTSTGSISDDFYIEHDGRIYGPEDIKMSAECISRFGKLSPCYELYESFLNSGMDPDDSSDAHGYVKWGDGITYNVRIIGINHDDKSDGTGKAGLTFQFVGLLNTPYYMSYPTCGTLDHFGFKEGVFNSTNKGFEYGSHDTIWTGRWEHSTNIGGWGKALLRHRMNPGVQSEGLNSGSDGRDADDLWKQVPQSLSQAVVAVDKKYYNGRLPDRPTLCTASDQLFLPSYSEVVAKGYAPNIASLSNEGPVYAYYSSKATAGNASNGALVKHQILKDGTSSASAWTWLLRSCDWERDTAFLAVGDAGNPYSPRTATQIYGIAPCFAL